MEVTALESMQPIAHDSTTMEPTMEIDMDLDLGAELGPDPIILESDPALANSASLEHPNTLTSNEEPQFEKVHVRGVDELTTDDIKRFATEHFQREEPARIEWIDDTSANIIYSSTDAGLQALAAFTQQSIEESDTALPSLRLRTAKLLSTHPDSVLQVRSAVKSDRKMRRAHEASRFYMLHPEHDPREKMRKEFARRRPRREREDSTGDYNRRRFDEREHRRRKDLSGEDNFDETMYDDNPGAGNDSRGPRGRGRFRNDNDLFPDHSDKSNGRLRDRSASPSRAEFSSNGALLNSNRNFRDRSPRARNGNHRHNAGKELFGSRSASGDDNCGRRELFPNKTAANYIKKELFPSKSAVSNHRRTDAFDAADETADLFAKRISVPLVDGAFDNESRMDVEDDDGYVELSKDPPVQANKGLKIRGKSDKPGFQIRGNAASMNTSIAIKDTASVKELFPSKYTGSEGKELFSDKLEGRGGRRKRAEDMFH